MSLAALQRLPRLLVEHGYVDTVSAYGLAYLGPAVAQDVEQLAPATATLVRLFYMHAAVTRAELGRVMPLADVDGLVQLGVLVARDQMLSTARLVALPLLGSVALVPSPKAAPRVYVGDDTLALLARLAPERGRALVLGAGAGLVPLRLAATAAQVVAVEHDPTARGCAELSLAMNGVADRVVLRDHALTEPMAILRGGETFDLVTVVAPASPLPFPPGARDGDGPAIARGLLSGLPEALAATGMAQLLAAWHGGEQGPDVGMDLDAWAAAEQLRLTMTVVARQPTAPGSPLFESLVARAHQLTPSIDGRELRRAYGEHLAARGATHLYLTVTTVSRAPSGEVARNRLDRRRGGEWFRR